jgi:hypothetical protein
METARTAELLKRTHDSDAISKAALVGGFNAARSALREMLREVAEVRFDLAEVDEEDARQKGGEELNQKLGAFQRQAEKWLEQTARLQRIAAEIERETPRIAEQLGVELG